MNNIKGGKVGMSELNQKEVNEQMYLFVKRWLDDLTFEEFKKVPVMAISYCLARLSKQDALLKEQETKLIPKDDAMIFIEEELTNMSWQENDKGWEAVNRIYEKVRDMNAKGR